MELIVTFMSGGVLRVAYCVHRCKKSLLSHGNETQYVLRNTEVHRKGSWKPFRQSHQSCGLTPSHLCSTLHVVEVSHEQDIRKHQAGSDRGH